MLLSFKFIGSTKGALDMLTKMMALELGPQKVKTTALNNFSFYLFKQYYKLK